MKKKYIAPLFTVMFLSIIFWACKKNELRVAPFDYTDGMALLKINYSSPYALNPGVQIKVNGVKVSNAITYSTPFPGGGLNTGGSSNADYLAVSPGIDTITISILNVGTNVDSILLYKTSVELTANVYQTLHITDTAAATKSVLLTDLSNKSDSGFTKFRFVNLIPNSSAGIDLYLGTVKMASAIGYLQATDTFSVAAGTAGAWTLRTAGGTATLGTAYTNTASTANQRVFTAYARGYIGPATTDIRSPKISFAYNK